jgi:hypothetical protein
VKLALQFSRARSPRSPLAPFARRYCRERADDDWRAGTGITQSHASGSTASHGRSHLPRFRPHAFIGLPQRGA